MIGRVLATVGSIFAAFLVLTLGSVIVGLIVAPAAIARWLGDRCPCGDHR